MKTWKQYKEKLEECQAQNRKLKLDHENVVLQLSRIMHERDSLTQMIIELDAEISHLRLSLASVRSHLHDLRESHQQGLSDLIKQIKLTWEKL